MTGRAALAGRAAALIALLAYGVINMAPFELRMATLYEDDGPLFYAHAFREPSRFAGDIVQGIPFEELLPLKVFTTAQNWIPALLFRYGDVDPYPVTWLLTWLQGVGLGLGMALLAWRISGRLSVAIASALFAYLTAPWSIDLANYANDGSLTFVPYPANLATPFLLLAFERSLSGRALTAVVLLGLCGFIHPGLGVYGAGALTLVWLAGGQPFARASLTRMAALTAVVAAFVAPALAVQWCCLGPTVSMDVAFAGFRQNAHLWPWANASWLSDSVVIAAAWLALTLLCIRESTGAERRLWVASVVVAAVFSIAQYAGAVLGNALLVNLIGLRAWMVPSLIGVPIVISFVAARVAEGTAWARLVALLILALALLGARGPFVVPLVASFALATTSRSIVATSISVAIAVAWAVAFALGSTAQGDALGLLARLIWPMRVWPPVEQRVIVLGAVVLVTGVLALAGRVSARTGRSLFAVRWVPVVALYLLAFSVVRVEAVRAAVDPSSSDWLTADVQRWAREQSPEGSRFVVLRPGWRTLALRRRMDAFTRESYAYMAPEKSEAWRRQLLAFYGVTPDEADALRGGPLVRRQIEQFRHYREPDFLRLANQFGATHLVLPSCYRETDVIELDLPVLYTNACYVVYGIDRTIVADWKRDLRAKAAATLASARLSFDPSALAGDASPGATGIAIAGSRQIVSGPSAGTNALRLAADTRITLPPDALTPASGTLSLWARLDPALRPYADLVRVNASNALYIFHTDGAFHVQYSGGALGTTPAPQDRGWHHYAFTWRHEDQRFYIDGIERIRGNRSALTAPVTLVALGWLGDRDGEQWAGDLGRVALFSQPLSAAEVRALARAMAADEGTMRELTESVK